MEVEIIDGTVEIDIDAIVNEVINSGQLSHDVNDLVQDSIDFDEIRYNIEDDILSQVNDHVELDLYYRTDELDMDEIRNHIEDDILGNVPDWIDYDRISAQVQHDLFVETMSTIESLSNMVDLLNRRIEALESEPRLSVWSRVVRFFRRW